MTRNERQLKAVQQQRDEIAQKSTVILEKQAEEDRELSEEETKQLADLVRDMKNLDKVEEDLNEAVRLEKELTRKGRDIGITDQRDEKHYAQPKRAKSLGEQFVESEGFKALRDRGLTGSWSTGQVELETKATLVEGDNYDAASGTPGAGAPLVPIDQRPGVVQTLFERLTVADLLAQGQTNSNSIRYVKESVATNAAATVAEGAAKPESTLEFSTEDDPVRKIATFLPVSDEMLEDAPAIQSYINARLSLFVQIEEEDQLLNGNGSGNNIEGLIKRVPAANLDIASSASNANNADHIYAAITHVRTTSFLEPDAIVINPDDWEVLRLLKDTTNNYIAGPPFANNNNFSGEPQESLWGKRVVVTQAIQGQILIGAFRTAAQLFRRGGLSVEASNSHSDYFVKNLTAIRAEERLGLAVYRPQAFATVDIAS